jgi:hypothetical protein
MAPSQSGAGCGFNGQQSNFGSLNNFVVGKGKGYSPEVAAAAATGDDVAKMD